MNRQQFLREIERIFQVAFTQKMFQTVLRAAWLGGAVYLLCWGANRLWGWLPAQWSWFLIAGLTALLTIGLALLEREPSKRFVWRLDRGYRLQEQVYTAYEFLDEERRKGEEQPGVDELLQSDQLARLPFLRRELADKGWHLKGEFLSTLVVLILLLIVYLLSVGDIARLPQKDNNALLPNPWKEPSASEVLSVSIPGDVLGGDISQVLPEGNSSAPPQICEGDFSQLTAVLAGLGEQLRQQPATYEIGVGMTSKDFDRASSGFGSLAEEVDDLSPESRGQLAQQFLDAAVALQDIGRPEVSTYFQEAAAALFEGNQPVITEELDQLASLMNQCDQCLGTPSQPIANSSQQSLILEGAPGEVPNPANFFSNPVIVEGGGISIAEGGTSNPGEDVSSFYYSFPYNYNLEDSDVVSSYFSPR